MIMKEALSHAIERWKLDDMEVIYEQSAKCVYSAGSKEFGPVILKADQDKLRLQSEYRMLVRLSGHDSCKVYAFDESDGILLEERIIPGTVLRSEVSLEKRIQAFLRVFHEIHVPERSGTTYLNWLEQIHAYCAGHQGAEEMAARAHRICKEIFEKYPDRVLLHGDLHHDNLLQRRDGSYAIIDPKGVVGPAILDMPRFMLNELDTSHSCPHEQHVEEVIRLLGEKTAYPAGDLRKLFYMETVLDNVWCMEDGEEMNRQEIELAASVYARAVKPAAGS